MNHTNLTDTNNDEVTFEAVMEAIQSGNNAEIDRLMSLPEKETEGEAATETTEEVEVTAEEGTQEGETPQVVNTETPNEEAAPAASTATESKEVDELAALKEELHRLKSDAGRVPFLQRRMQEMDRELRAYKARTATTETPNSVSANPENVKPELPANLKKRIDELRRIDPDLAETFEEFHKEVQQTKIAAVETVIQREQEEADQQFFYEQKAELLRHVPQADQLFATPEWKQWKENLTPGRLALTQSGYATDMVKAIYEFAADMRAQFGNVTSTANSGGGGPNSTSAVTQAQNQNSVVQDARTRKVAVAAEVKSPAAKAAVTFDEEAAFKEAYATQLKKMGLSK